MKDRILQILKRSSDYVSGELMSRQLGVTRAAVWKAVRSLRKAGYPIEAANNRGYKLKGLADVLTEIEIRENIKNDDLSGFIRDIVFESMLDSTNRLARQAAEMDAPDPGLYVADCQTDGRGRRGKPWYSNNKQGLWFSLLLRPTGDSASLTKITLLAGLAVAEALNSFDAKVAIKWPNDLVATESGKKIGGILTEMTVEETTVTSLIIGIGLNTSQQEFPPELAEIATSLYLETGFAYRRVDILSTILRIFASRYSEFKQTESWLPDYKRLCLTLDREVKVVNAGDITGIKGTAVDLDGEGELVIEDKEGKRHTIRSGEVSIRGFMGYV